MKQEITLNRSKGRRVTFIGEEIINESTKEDRADSRWKEVLVYMTDDGYMAGIASKTNWVGERDALYVVGPATKEEIISSVRTHAPELEEIISRQMKTLDSFINKNYEPSRDRMES